MLTTGNSQGEKKLDPGFRVISQEARKGNADAQFRLGIAYLNGFYGLQADPDAAADLFELAALQNHPDAQYFLAEMRLTGIGVNQDLVEAFTWLLIAKEKSPLAAKSMKLFNSILKNKYRNNKDAFTRLYDKVIKKVTIKKEQIKPPPQQPEKLPPITPQNLILASGYAHFIQQVPRFYDHGFELFMQDNPLSKDLFDQVKRVRAEVIKPEKLEQQMRQRLEKLLSTDEIARGYIWLSSPLVSQVIKAESDATSLEGYQQILQNGKKNVAQLIDTGHLAVVQRFDSPYLPESRTEDRYPAGRIDFATMIALYFRGTTLGTIPTVDHRLDPTFEVTEKMLKKHHLTGQATAFNGLSKVSMMSYSNLVRSRVGRKLTRAIVASFDATIREARETYAHNLPDELAVHKPTPDFRIGTAQIVNFGLMQQQNKYREESPATTSGKVTLVSGNKIVQRTTNIPAQQGLNFGITYQINSNERGVSFPVTIRLTHPPITNPTTGKTTTVDEWISKPHTNSPHTDAWKFVEQWEIAPGKWTFSVLYRDEDNPIALYQTLLEKTFFVGEKNPPYTLNQIEEIDDIYLSDDGRYMGIKARSKYVEISFWDLSTQKILGRTTHSIWYDHKPIIFSPTNPNIAITQNNVAGLTVWDLKDLNNSFNLLAITGGSSVIERIFGPAGKFFYTVYDTANTTLRRRNTVTKVWDLENKKLIAAYSPFMDISIHPQEKYLAGESNDCSIQIMNLETGELVFSDKREGICQRYNRTKNGHQLLRIVQKILVEETAIIYYSDGRCDYIDLRTGKTFKQTQVGEPEMRNYRGAIVEGGGFFSLDASGRNLMFKPRGRGGKKEIWNPRTGTKILSFRDIIKYNNNGTKAVVIDRYKDTITMWDLVSGKELYTINNEQIQNAEVSSDFKSIAIVKYKKYKYARMECETIQIRNLETNSIIRSIQINNDNSPVFRHDLSIALINDAKYSDGIDIWNLNTGKRVGNIQNTSRILSTWELGKNGKEPMPVIEIKNDDGTFSLIDPFTLKPARGSIYGSTLSVKNGVASMGSHLLNINNDDRSKNIFKGKE
jgi:WD40 repeat protein